MTMCIKSCSVELAFCYFYRVHLLGEKVIRTFILLRTTNKFCNSQNNLDNKYSKKIKNEAAGSVSTTSAVVTRSKKKEKRTKWEEKEEEEEEERRKKGPVISSME